MTEHDGLSYFNVEKTFVEYFDRLLSIGFTINDISEKLPSIEKYYHQIVIQEGGLHRLTIHTLFFKWSKHRQSYIV